MSTTDEINAAVAAAVKGLEAKITELTKERDEEKAAKDKFALEAEKARKNANQILTEKRELQGKPGEKRAVSIDGVIVTDQALQVPHEMVRNNPAAYRMWKARAEEQGLAFEMFTPDAVEQKTTAIPKRYTDEGERTHYVSQAYLSGDGALYREEKAFADQNKFKLVVVNDPDQLPEAAFNAGD